MSRRKWIDPQDFRDLRRASGLTRAQAGEALDVTTRTIQNWETGGARIPWMAYRMLRILRGYALPGLAWEGWTLRGATLYSPTDRGFDARQLETIEHVFAQARLWRQDYASKCLVKPASTVLPFPDLKRSVDERPRATVTQFPIPVTVTKKEATR